jgi:hypothetical protein
MVDDVINLIDHRTGLDSKRLKDVILGYDITWFGTVYA